MNATRTVPGRPVNDTATVTTTIIDLIADTLDRSSYLDADDIRTELADANAALGLLAVGGHVRRGELVLIAAGLRLRIDVPVGEDALTATAHLDPARGAATANDWSLHLPTPDALSAIVAAAARTCPHVTLDAAPSVAPTAQNTSAASAIDLSRLTDTRAQR